MAQSSLRKSAEKTVVLKMPTQPLYIEGYHRPDYLDPDDAVYDAISDILSNGRTSRLYRSLVRDQQIAAGAEGFSGFPGDKYPGLFAFLAVPLPGHTPEQMRDAIHKEIDKLKTADVTDEELADVQDPQPGRPAARTRRQRGPGQPARRPTNSVTATGANSSINWTRSTKSPKPTFAAWPTRPLSTPTAPSGFCSSSSPKGAPSGRSGHRQRRCGMKRHLHSSEAQLDRHG